MQTKNRKSPPTNIKLILAFLGRDSGKLSQLIVQLCQTWVADSREYSQKCFHLRGCCGTRQNCQPGKTPFFHFYPHFPKNIIKDITGPCFVKT